MMKGAQNQIKIVRVTSKLSHWDLRLKCNKQNNNLQEYSDLDAVRQQCNEQDNYWQEYPDLDADLRQQCNEQDNHWQEYPDLDVGLRLQCNEQDNNLQEYPDVGADMQEYTEEGNSFEEYSEEYDETNLEEGIQPELDTFHQYVKVKGEIIEELNSSDNLTQFKEEMLSDIEIDEREIDTGDFSYVNIRVKEEFSEIKRSESTPSIFDEINKQNKEVDVNFDKDDKFMKHCTHVNISIKTEEKVDEVQKSSKPVAIPGTELTTFECNVCLKAFLGGDAYNEHMIKHTTKDISSPEVIPSNRVVKIGNPLSDNWVMVKVKKIRVKRHAKDKANENKSTKKYFTTSSAKKYYENGVKSFTCTNPKKYANSAKNIDDSNTTPNNNYSIIPNNNNYVEVDNDSSTVKVDDNDSNKSVKINGDRIVTIDNDNDPVDNDSKVKVDEDYDNSAVKKNEGLLVEIPRETKIAKLPKGKGKLPKEITKMWYKNHISVTYKVCDKSCANKKFCTQSKECRRKQKTKEEINTYFACTQCDYRGKRKHHLDRHMLTHTRVKHFCCNLCDYKGGQQCHLDQHMRTHSKSKPYSCKFCDYKCVQRRQLDQHMRTHTGVKMFSCNKCEYTCTQRCHLDQHMRIHTGIRLFSCVHCDYKCVQRSHLNQHIVNMHRNVNVFECSHCSYRCLRLDMLVQHMNIH